MTYYMFKVACPYIIGDFKEHNNLKDTILKIIDEEPGDDTTYNFKTDYTISETLRKQHYPMILFEPINNYMNGICNKLGYSYTKIKNVWYQQYVQGSIHDWHVHNNCQWTNVYYLEFPEGSPKTQMMNPINPDEIIEFQVKEGSILTFPSFFIHRAPKVESNLRKTIISFNHDFYLEKSIY